MRHHAEGEQAEAYDEDMEYIRMKRRMAMSQQMDEAVTTAKKRVMRRGKQYKAVIQKWRPGLTTVRESRIENAGKGLFALVDMLPGDRIARYSGEEMDADRRKMSDSKYIVKIHENLYLDGEMQTILMDDTSMMVHARDWR